MTKTVSLWPTVFFVPCPDREDAAHENRAQPVVEDHDKAAGLDLK